MRPILGVVLGFLTLIVLATAALKSLSIAKDESSPERQIAPAPISITFDAYGAIGDGSQPDKMAMQSAVKAAAGGTVYGVKGKIYTLRGQVYIPSDTTIDCRGAVVQFDPTLGSIFVNALFWIGYGNGRGASNVEIRNCNFESTLGYQNAAITFQPGSNRISIHDNHFRNTAGYALRAVNLAAAHVSDVNVSNNTAEDVAYLFFLNGAETQAFIHCYTVPDGLPCRNLVGQHPPSPGTVAMRLPAPLVEDIDKGYRYGVIVLYRNNGLDSHRLFGPADNGSDFTYADGTISFARALPTGPDIDVVKVFTWKPEQAPANDARKISIIGNTGHRFRAAAVQINCPVRAFHERTPGRDCVRDVTVTHNRFDGAYQLEGMFNSFPIGRARANLVLWSQDFSKAVWFRHGQAMPAAGFESPPYDQTKTAQRLIEDTSDSGHGISQAIEITPGTPYTWSCSMRAAERNKARLSLLTKAGNGVTADFDLAAGRLIGGSNVRAGHALDAGVAPQWKRLVSRLGDRNT